MHHTLSISTVLAMECMVCVYVQSACATLVSRVIGLAAFVVRAEMHALFSFLRSTAVYF